MSIKIIYAYIWKKKYHTYLIFTRLGSSIRDLGFEKYFCLSANLAYCIINTCSVSASILDTGRAAQFALLYTRTNALSI